jgi:hypothetical protein
MVMSGWPWRGRRTTCAAFAQGPNFFYPPHLEFAPTAQQSRALYSSGECAYSERRPQLAFDSIFHLLGRDQPAEAGAVLCVTKGGRRAWRAAAMAFQGTSGGAVVCALGTPAREMGV